MAEPTIKIAMFDKAITIEVDANTAKRATSRKETAVARRRYQMGSLAVRGKRRKVWVARWREDVTTSSVIHFDAGAIHPAAVGTRDGSCPQT